MSEDEFRRELSELLRCESLDDTQRQTALLFRLLLDENQRLRDMIGDLADRTYEQPPSPITSPQVARNPT